MLPGRGAGKGFGRRRCRRRRTPALFLILLRSYDRVAQRDVAIKVIDLEDMCEPA